MRKVFLDDLPKNNKGVDWSKCKGRTIRFVYNEYAGELTLGVYEKGKQVITFIYKENEYAIRTGDLKKGEFGRKIGLVSHLTDFKYNIGEVVNNKKILKRYVTSNCYGHKQKKYQYECEKCGHYDDVIEAGILWNCPVCCGIKIDENINSVKALYPDVYKSLLNKNEGLLSAHNKRRVFWECQHCKTINKHSIRYLCAHCKNICLVCGDGMSMPEKILNAVFEQISSTYQNKVRFSWSDNREYDIYDNGIFVEIHGGQHKIKSFETCGGRTLEEEIENDKYKMQLAQYKDENYRDYIIIWADKSSFNYIKANIMSSELTNYYDLSKVNWDYVREKVRSSFLKEVCDLFNDGISLNEIALIKKCASNTIREYLKLGTEMKLCNYIPRKNQYV